MQSALYIWLSRGDFRITNFVKFNNASIIFSISQTISPVHFWRSRVAAFANPARIPQTVNTREGCGTFSDEVITKGAPMYHYL